MKTAMILAAGRGERLKPITDKIPKALCVVRGKPIIEYHLEKLAEAGYERVVINHAYLGGKIVQYLGCGARWNLEICYCAEPPGGLETGGGIYNALRWLNPDHFLTINADIFSNYSLNNFIYEDKAPIQLLLIENPPNRKEGDFGLKDGLVTNDKLFTFTGISYYRTEVIHQLQMGRFSITPIIRKYASQGLVRGQLLKGYWLDIGTPQMLKLANEVSFT